MRPSQRKIDAFLGALAEGLRPREAARLARLRIATVGRLCRSDLAFAVAYLDAAYKTTYPNRPPVDQVVELALVALSPDERTELARIVGHWAEPVPEARAA